MGMRDALDRADAKVAWRWLNKLSFQDPDHQAFWDGLTVDQKREVMERATTRATPASRDEALFWVALLEDRERGLLTTVQVASLGTVVGLLVVPIVMMSDTSLGPLFAAPFGVAGGMTVGSVIRLGRLRRRRADLTVPPG